MDSSSASGTTPFELNVRFEDLSSEQRVQLQRVFKLCLNKIASAKGELDAALRKPVKSVMTHFKILGTDPRDRQDIQAIRANYNVIVGVLLGHAKVIYDGEHTGPAFGLGKLVGKNVQAYVRSLGPLKPGETGEIKIVKPEFFGHSLESQGRFIIHEVAHVFVGLEDHKYYDNSSAIRISRTDALRNADTYAYFAIPSLTMRL